MSFSSGRDSWSWTLVATESTAANAEAVATLKDSRLCNRSAIDLGMSCSSCRDSTAADAEAVVTLEDSKHCNKRCSWRTTGGLRYPTDAGALAALAACDRPMN
jgi:hypothetical protein